MSESIDIESLDPLYRDVFRDPANGTPDKITTEGCLRLAQLGKDKWNAWRKSFPVLLLKSNVNSGIATHQVQTQNFATFQFCTFDVTSSDLAFFNFSGMTYFRSATFDVSVSFDKSIFGWLTDFQKAVFNDSAIFSSAKFEDQSLFEEVTFKRPVRFQGAKFNGETSFAKARFCEDANFENCEFSAVTSFANTRFAQAPLFHGCKFHSNTNFDGAVFPAATGSSEAIRAYRTLKLAFSQQQAVREEQRFFRLEMAEEAARATGVQRFLYKAYALCSDYGFSVARPLALLALTLLGFAGIYGLLSWVHHCLPSQAACQFNSAWAEFSLIQALPLPGLDKLGEELRKTLFPSSGGISILVTLAVIFHKTISIAALFLGGLALRNLFKLK